MRGNFSCGFCPPWFGFYWFDSIFLFFFFVWFTFTLFEKGVTLKYVYIFLFWLCDIDLYMLSWMIARRNMEGCCSDFSNWCIWLEFSWIGFNSLILNANNPVILHLLPDLKDKRRFRLGFCPSWLLRTLFLWISVWQTWNLWIGLLHAFLDDCFWRNLEFFLSYDMIVAVIHVVWYLLARIREFFFGQLAWIGFKLLIVFSF